jgi:hypothetical protein
MRQPALPLELWRLVFCHATCLPGYMDTSYLPPLVNEPRAHTFYDNNCHCPIVMRPMATSLALSLVCKLWHNIMIEYLYESIYLFGPAQISRLIDAITGSIERASRPNEHDPIHHYGWYVRRIDVKLWPWWTSPLPLMDRNGLLNILLSLCDRLQILSLDYESLWTKECDPIDAPSLLDHAASLQFCRMKWQHGPNMLFSISLLSSSSNLEYLEFNAVLESCPRQPLSFPRLHTMELYLSDNRGSDIVPWVAGWHLPALQTLSIFGGFERIQDARSSWESVLRSFGSNLLVIKTADDDWAGNMLSTLIDVYCPTLQELWAPAKAFRLYKPSLLHIRRICLPKAFGSRQALDETMRSVLGMERSALQRIRLYGPSTVLDLCNTDEWVETWASEKVQLEVDD